MVFAFIVIARAHTHTFNVFNLQIPLLLLSFGGAFVQAVSTPDGVQSSVIYTSLACINRSGHIIELLMDWLNTVYVCVCVSGAIM